MEKIDKIFDLKRKNMKKTFITLAALALLAVSFSGCASTGGHKKDCCQEKESCCEDNQHKADHLGAGCCG